MHGRRIEGLEEAQRRLRDQLPPRFWRLDALHRYVDGTQYEGRPDFFSPENDCPLQERAPCIVAPVVESAIAQHVDFALGEGRFPKLTTGIAEDESDLGGSGLTEKQSKTVDQFISLLVEHARLQDAAQDALASAEGTGTAVAVVAARAGCVEVETLDPRYAAPVFSKDGRTLDSIDVRQPYIDIYQDAGGGLRARCLVYRRAIDAQRDVVYLPAEAPPDGREPKWAEDKAKSAEHGLGFCPAIWWRFRVGSRRVDSIDGRAIHTALLDEVDSLNFGLSQRHRAALYSGDPQLWETGVDENEQVAPMGSEPRATIMTGNKIVDGLPVKYSKFGFTERAKMARRKGAGVVWRYERAESKVGMLTLPGDALSALDDHCSDLESKLYEALSHTQASPENVKGAMSGKALGFLYARTTTHVDRVRRDLWDGFLCPLVSMVLRLVYVVETRSAGSLYVTGAKKALPILSRFLRETAGGSDWHPPRIKPVWGRYFDASAEDQLSEVRVSKEAFEGGLITRELAVEKLRGVFQFESAAEIAEQLDEEAAEAAKVAQEAPQEAAGDVDGDKPTGTAKAKPGLKKAMHRPGKPVAE